MGSWNMQYFVSPNCDLSNLRLAKTQQGRPLYNIKNHMKNDKVE